MGILKSKKDVEETSEEKDLGLEPVDDKTVSPEEPETSEATTTMSEEEREKANEERYEEERKNNEIQNDRVGANTVR